MLWVLISFPLSNWNDAIRDEKVVWGYWPKPTLKKSSSPLSLDVQAFPPKCPITEHCRLPHLMLLQCNMIKKDLPMKLWKFMNLFDLKTLQLLFHLYLPAVYHFIPLKILLPFLKILQSLCARFEQLFNLKNCFKVFFNKFENTVCYFSQKALEQNCFF